MSTDLDFHKLMRRFAPEAEAVLETTTAAKKRRVEAAAAKALLVVAAAAAPQKMKRKKFFVIGRVLPIDVWARIIKWLRNVSSLILLSMVNRSLHNAIRCRR